VSILGKLFWVLIRYIEYVGFHIAPQIFRNVIVPLLGEKVSSVHFPLVRNKDLVTMSSNFLKWVTKYNLPRCSLVHAGAHFAEERDSYSELGFEPVFWIEALPSVAEICRQNLVDYPNQQLLIYALGEKCDERVVFYVAGQESSASSILEPHLISASHPEVSVTEKIVLRTTTLDSLYQSNAFGFEKSYGLVLDLQGAEGKVLSGGHDFLSKVDFIISEVSTRALYKEGMRFKDLTTYLDHKGFSLLSSEVNRATGWGDALYISRKGNFSNVLKNNQQDLVVRGHFSVGTLIRSCLVLCGFPLRLIRRIHRR
jgi:FkbM family methyltransferase